MSATPAFAYQPFPWATKNPVWFVFGVQSSASRTGSAGGGLADADGDGEASAEAEGAVVGTADGTTEAEPDGVAAGAADGAADGEAGCAGVAEGATDGVAEEAADAEAAPVADGVVVPAHATSVLLSRTMARMAVRARADARTPGSCCSVTDSIASAMHENAVPGTQDGGESMGLLPSLV